MMPVLWSLQTQYLAKCPKELSHLNLLGVILLYVIGWSIRFSADYQKVKFRQTRGKYSIWGRKGEGIKASYQTTDGKSHQILLLCSGKLLHHVTCIPSSQKELTDFVRPSFLLGWWGLARHANYTGSTMYTLALCAACGNGGIFPYTEVIILIGLHIHRCYRDEAKCAAKYGTDWDEYCRRVPWRMIPGLF